MRGGFIRNMNIIALRKKIIKLAMEFGLDYSDNIFTRNFVDRKDNALLGFMVRDPDYDEFGKSTKNRLLNLDLFLSSDKFLKAGRSAQIVNMRYANAVVKNIDNQRIRSRLQSLLKNLESYKGNAVVITKPVNSRDKKFVKSALYHEWIHALLRYNGLNTGDWKVNEGLCVYLEYYSGTVEGRDLEFLYDVIKDVRRRGYVNNFDVAAEYSERFVNLFENKTDPAVRRVVLSKFLNRLNARH